MKSYKLYKGLQKPLVLMGYRGRYIYWAAGSVFGGVLVGLICFIAIGKIVGALVIIGLAGGGLLYTNYKMSKGLYDKDNQQNTLFIIETNINLIPYYGKKRYKGKN